MSKRYRVTDEGLRVITPRGVYWLPPGTVIDEMPDRWEGSVELVVEHDQQPKRVDGYADKAIHPGMYEDKGI